MKLATRDELARAAEELRFLESEARQGRGLNAYLAAAQRAREERARFYYTLNRFLNANPIDKKPCVCGATRVQMHHPDYTEPFKVAFLCVRCHRHHHRGLLRRIFHVYDVRDLAREKLLTVDACA